MTASVVILSRHGYHYLSRLLPALVPCLKQASIPLKNVLVKISPEDEREKNLIQQYPFSHIVIPDDEFNHGGTREQLRTFFATDITIFLTQDILPAQENFLTHLLKPFADRKIGVAYSRQIPHVGADFFESFPREFNYPAQSQIRSLQDLPQYGSFLFFCSNSCAAWRNKALNEVGGFPETITNEDTLATAKLLQAGYKIAYIAESMVYHSHRYTLWQEFTRYFDTGYVRRLYRNNLFLGERDEKHGSKFSKAFLKTLAKQAPWKLPYGILHLGVKWLGFKLGYASQNWPNWLKKKLSMQKYYWR